MVRVGHVWIGSAWQGAAASSRRRAALGSRRPTARGMPAVGELVRSTSGQRMVKPPLRCPRGHPLRPGRMLVGTVLVRPALDVALRVRRSHLRAGAWPPGAACCTGRRGCAASRDWRRRLHCWPYVMPVANSPNYLEMEPSIARPTHGQGRIDWPPEIDAALLRRGCPRPGR